MFHAACRLIPDTLEANRGNTLEAPWNTLEANRGNTLETNPGEHA